VPLIPYWGVALTGCSVIKISDRVIAANRESQFIAPRRAGEEGREQEREQHRAPLQSNTRSRLHVFLRTTVAKKPTFSWLRNTELGTMLCVCN
jgi:hypothetical protein